MIRFASAPTRYVLARLALLTAAILMVTFSVPALAPTSAAAAPSELLTNGDFSAGTTGWRTNSPSQRLTVLGGSNPIAQLTTSLTQNATLNDSPNVVTNVAKGSTFTLTARVRTTTPSVRGALRVREVAGGTSMSHQSSFNLTTNSWQTITLDLMTTLSGAHLDVNLVAWSLPSGKTLQIDWISMKQGTAADPTPEQPCRGVPPSGTKFGMSAWTQNYTLEQSIARNDRTFGRIPILRYFAPGLPMSWSSKTATLFKGRDLVVSFKVHPSRINDGSHDAFFRDWFATAPRDQTIYWSYFHEPENNINRGEFTTAQYRAAWTRLAGLAQQVCKPNLLSTLILTEWTMNPRSNRDYRTYDAGKAYVDVLAFDPYNGVWDPNRNYYQTPKDLLGHIADKMRADGRPWGLAELGSRISVGDDGRGRAAWLTAIADYAKANNASFVTYFNTIGNGDWRLLDSRSQQAWAAQVARSN